MGTLIKMLGGAELAVAVLLRCTIGSRYSGGLIYAMPAEVTVGYPRRLFVRDDAIFVFDTMKHKRLML